MDERIRLMDVLEGRGSVKKPWFEFLKISLQCCRITTLRR